VTREEMSVTAKICLTLRHLSHSQDTVEVNGSTVGECLNDLVRQVPEIEPKIFEREAKLLSYVEIYVNQKSSYPEELAKPVKDGDELTLTVMMVGG
jgi:molybdopterin converting factor small subunit